MASVTKQQKRAKRAKVKAKQQRIARSVHQPARFDDFPDGPDAYPIEAFEALFTQFQEAEKQSRKELFLTLFISLADVFSANQDLGQELEQSGDPAEAMAALSQSFLVDYRQWAHGATEEETLEWLDRPEVIEDFAQAMDEAADELAAGLSEDDE
jgi:hypothetical protein